MHRKIKGKIVKTYRYTVTYFILNVNLYRIDFVAAKVTFEQVGTLVIFDNQCIVNALSSLTIRLC